MDSGVLVAVLGFLGTCVGSLAGTFGGMKLYAYRLEVLEKRMDKTEKRVDDMEKQQIVVVEQINVMKGKK